MLTGKQKRTPSKHGIKEGSMLTRNFRIRCDICNKIMSFDNDRYEWVCFGNRFDIEPSPCEHSHIDCYENNERLKRLIESVAWIKPYKVAYKPDR